MKTPLISIIISIIILSSCSYHMGNIGGGSAAITDANYSNIDFAYGAAKTVNVLGIGGNQKDALVLEAKRNLYLNYNLKPGQAIGQTTIDFKRTFFFPVLVTKVTLSAEIIDFSEDEINQSDMNENFKSFVNEPKNTQLFFGEKVLYFSKGDTIPARFLGIDGANYFIKYFDESNNLRIKHVSPFKISPELNKRITLNKLNDYKLSTPENPVRELMTFRYDGEEYTGELINRVFGTYLIRMTLENGEFVGVYVEEKDIVK